MSGYDDLGTTIGQLKRAAIDAFMRCERAGWDVREDEYRVSSRGPDFMVSRPGPDGEGGGNWSSSEWLGDPFGWNNDHKDAEYSGIFDEIRSTIDELVKPWLDLPDPEKISLEVEHLRQAFRTLSLGSSAAGGEATGAGTLAGHLTMIQENSDELAGATIATFKAQFVAQLPAVIGGHHALTVVLGSALAAQQGIWEAARQDVTEIIASAKDAFTAVAEGGGGDWTVLLTVAGYAGKGFNIFATGGMKKAVEVGNLALEVLKGATTGEKKESKASGGDYASTMDGFVQALEDLNSAITAEETAVQDNMTTNLANVRADQTSYDLQPPPPLTAEEEIIVITPSLVDEIVDVYLPAVATELGTAASHVYDGWGRYPYQRDAAVGLGTYGPSEEVNELNWMLYELLKNLQMEVGNGATNLKLAVEHVLTADDDVRRALEEHAERVARRADLYDPWD